MKIYNENMELIMNPNLSLGYLKPHTYMKHHAAVQEVKEEWHYETVREYPNGGRDVQKVIDVPAVKGQEPWDEEVSVLIYIPYTQEELNAIESRKNKPTWDNRIEAQILYTAMMTDTLLEEV